MKKNVFKEVIIALLLCLVIMLVFALVLYQFVPNNKTLPPQVSYITPKEVSEELVSNSGVDEDEIIMTYEVNTDDINNYERTNDYNPGKANPFQVLSTSPDGGTSSDSSNSNVNGGTTGGASSESASSGSSSTSNGGTSKQGSGSSSSSSPYYNDHGSGK